MGVLPSIVPTVVPCIAPNRCTVPRCTSFTLGGQCKWCGRDLCSTHIFYYAGAKCLCYICGNMDYEGKPAICGTMPTSLEWKKIYACTHAPRQWALNATDIVSHYTCTCGVDVCPVDLLSTDKCDICKQYVHCVANTGGRPMCCACAPVYSPECFTPSTGRTSAVPPPLMTMILAYARQ